MSKRILGSGGSRRRRLHLTPAVAVLIGAVIFSVFGVAAASGRTDATTGSGRHASTHPASAIFRSLLTGTIGTAAGFEDDDGNLAPATLTDWNSFAPVTWTGTAPYQTGTSSANGFTFLGLTDARAVTSDTGFAGGTKQNDVCPSVIGSKAQNKDDLARAYIASKTVAGHVYLEIAWVRIPQNTQSSDAHIAFEFNQSTTPCANNDGLVLRTIGDLLLFYDFQSGSATISLSTWDGSAWSAPVSLSAAGTAEAAVNTADVTDLLPPTAPETLGGLEFGEAGIDLTAAFTNLSQGGRACEVFGNAHIFSRSSGSGDTSQLQDLVGPTPLDLKGHDDWQAA